MKLILAEKPSLGRSIADAIPGQANGRDPIYKGDYCITWLYGHILTLMEPQDYDEAYQKWSLEQLPIYFENWSQKPSEGKEDRLNLIGTLLKDAELVIHAGDPDDEGQLLVDEVLRWFHYQGPVMRLDTANTTEAALSRALGKMENNETREIDGWAAYARSVADLMVGVNMSRFFTKNNGGRTLSVGRVQTPTLGLVVNRDLQIETHEKLVYYSVSGELDIDGKKIPYSVQFQKDDPRLVEGRMLSKTEADRIVKVLQNKELNNIQITNKLEAEKPPLPFNLVKLQTYCGNTWGYDPQKVMDITQKLKDAGAITYNRSDCQYLSSDHFREAPATVRTVCRNLGSRPEKLDTSIKSAAFNDANITAHFAIIPTDSNRDLSRFTEEERNVYTIIALYYLSQFMPPCQRRRTTLNAEIPGVGILVSSSAVVLEQGFRELLPAKAEAPTALSDFEDGTYTGSVLSASVQEKETKPPARYTKTSLNEDMTRIARYVEDPEVKRLLLEKDKDKKGENGSIGTSATRATIIDGLVARGFLEEKGKRLISTELGREFYRVLPDELKKPDMTAYWWVIQESIKAGEADWEALPEAVLKTIKYILTQTYPTLVTASISGDQKILGRCPRCGGYIIEGKNGFGCTGYKQGCKFIIWKKPKSSMLKYVTITEKMAVSLLAGETVPCKKLYSEKKHLTFYGGIKLEDQGAEYGPELTFVPLERTAIGTCPRCGKDIIEGSRGFGCSGYAEGCKFTIWKTSKTSVFKNITITEQTAKKLLAGETVATKHLYSEKKNTEFYGGFRLKDQGSDYGADLELVSLERPSIGTCPICGEPIVEGKNGFGCLGYKNGCKFIIWKKPLGSLFGKITITESMAKKLLAGETIATNKLYSEKKNTTFYGGFKLATPEPGKSASLELVSLERPPVGICPRCGGNVVEGKNAFGCMNYKDGCKFTIWKTSKRPMLSKITITEPMAKKLLAGEIVETNRLYLPSTNETFSGRLRMKDQGSDYGPELEILLSEKGNLGVCPRCGERVAETPISFRCVGHRKGCGFQLYKHQRGSLFKDVEITGEMMQTLLSGEAVSSDKLYSAKKEKYFSGSFRLSDKGGTYGADLELVPFARKASAELPAESKDAAVSETENLPLPDYVDAPLPEFFEVPDWESVLQEPPEQETPYLWEDIPFDN